MQSDSDNTQMGNTTDPAQEQPGDSDNTQMGNTTDPTQEQSGDSDNTQTGNTTDPAQDPSSITGAMKNLTLDNEPVLAKREVFKSYQYLIEDESGLHVWKPEALCGNQNSEDVKSIIKADKTYIARRKRYYKGTKWDRHGGQRGHHLRSRRISSFDYERTMGRWGGRYPNVAK